MGRCDCSVRHLCEHGRSCGILGQPVAGHSGYSGVSQVHEHPGPEEALAARVKKDSEEHGGKSWVSEEHEGIPTPHLTAEVMRRGKKEAAAPTMCWGHHVSHPLGAREAQADCVWLKGPAWCNFVSRDVPRLWEILEVLSPLALLPPPISRTTCSHWPLPPLLF